MRGEPRAILPLTALALASCAVVGPPPASSAAVDLEAVCPTQDVHGYTVQRGEVTGVSAGDAIAAARADATRALIERACRGLSDLRCVAIERHVKPWREGYFDPRSRLACASVSLQRELLDTLRRDAAVLESELHALADAAVRHIGAEPFAVPATTWASGCSAGPIGQVLQAGLFNQVATFPEARIVDADGQQDDVVRLVTHLAPGVGGVTLTARVLRPDQSTATPLPGFTFPLDLFEIAPDEVGQCRSDRDLGLASGERVGAGGLRVRAWVRGIDGVGCEGSTVEPAIRVNQPADVQVYSVAGDGRSLLVWPPPGVLPRVEGRLSLGEMRLVAQPEKGDERLVVVAMPPGASWGDLDGWRGFCASPFPLGPDAFPEGAAVGTATFSVLPSGQGECPSVAGVAALRSAVTDPPACRR